MNPSKSSFFNFFRVIIMVAIMTGCANNASVNPKYDIAPEEYEELSEQYLQHLANFEWEASYAFLSDKVVFKLPDGDTDTRTTYKGLESVKNFWDNYPQNSGNNKAVFTDFVHVPVQVNQKIDFVDVTGPFDICYFSAELSYGSEKAKVRMHWAFHFNDAKKIDGIFTYYDRTPIIEAANKNFLSLNKSDSEQEKQ